MITGAAPDLQAGKQSKFSLKRSQALDGRVSPFRPVAWFSIIISYNQNIKSICEMIC
jgi:hypothetical protein